MGHLPTYSSVSEAVGQLEQQKTDLEQRLDQRKAARLTDLQHIAQAIRKVPSTLLINSVVNPAPLGSGTFFMDPELFVWDPDLGKIEKRDLKKNQNYT